MPESNAYMPTLAPARPPAAEGVRLRVLEGSARGCEVELPDGVHRLGRGAGSPLPVDPAVDTLVSRLHAELRVEGGRCWLADAGSTNGTFRNGEPVGSETMLAPDDEVSLGPSDRGGAVVVTVHFAPPPGEPASSDARRAPRVRLVHGPAPMAGEPFGVAEAGGSWAGLLDRARSAIDRGLAPFLLPRLERTEARLREEAERAWAALGERMSRERSAGLAGLEAAIASVRAEDESAARQGAAEAAVRRGEVSSAASAEGLRARRAELAAAVEEARRAAGLAHEGLAGARRRVASALAGRIAALEEMASDARALAGLMANSPSEGVAEPAARTLGELRRRLAEIDAPLPDLREETAGVASAESSARDADARAAAAQAALAQAEAEGAAVHAEHQRLRAGLEASSAAARDERQARAADRRRAMASLGREAVLNGHADGEDGREAAMLAGRLRAASARLARLRGDDAGRAR